MCMKNMCKKLKNLNCVDVALIKLSAIVFTLMVAKLWSGILYLEWYWYLIMFVIFAIPVLMKMFK
jgi:hypothetical protein